MSTYQIETESGEKYEVEVEDSKPSKEPIKEKKSILPDITGLKQTDPYAGAVAQTGRDILTIPSHFFNQMALNQPRAITEKMGFEFPSETNNPVAGVAAKTAGLAGAVMSPAAKFLGGAVKAGKYGSAAIGGALTGAAYSPEDPTNIKQRLLQGGVGGITGGALAGIGNLSSKFNFGGEKAAKKIAVRAADDIAQGHNSFTTRYNAIMDTVGNNFIPSNLKTSLSQSADEVIDKISRIDKTGANVIDDVKEALNSENLTVRELHNLKGSIGERLRARPELRSLYHKFNEVLSEKEVAGKAYSKVTKNFDEFLNRSEFYVKNLIKDAKQTTGSRIANKKNLTQEQVDSLNLLSNYSQSKNLLPEIRAVIRGQEVKRLLSRYAPYIVGGGLLGGVAGYGGIRLARGVLTGE